MTQTKIINTPIEKLGPVQAATVSATNFFIASTLLTFVLQPETLALLTRISNSVSALFINSLLSLSCSLLSQTLLNKSTGVTKEISIPEENKKPNCRKGINPLESLIFIQGGILGSILGPLVDKAICHSTGFCLGIAKRLNVDLARDFFPEFTNYIEKVACWSLNTFSTLPPNLLAGTPKTLISIFCTIFVTALSVLACTFLGKAAAEAGWANLAKKTTANNSLEKYAFVTGLVKNLLVLPRYYQRMLIVFFKSMHPKNLVKKDNSGKNPLQAMRDWGLIYWTFWNLTTGTLFPSIISMVIRTIAGIPFSIFLTKYSKKPKP